MNNGTQPQGLIFDCDGTLADTMPLHWRAWRAIALRYKLDFPQDRFYALGQKIIASDMSNVLGMLVLGVDPPDNLVHVGLRLRRQLFY